MENPSEILIFSGDPQDLRGILEEVDQEYPECQPAVRLYCYYNEQQKGIYDSLQQAREDLQSFYRRVILSTLSEEGYAVPKEIRENIDALQICLDEELFRGALESVRKQMRGSLGKVN